jgi:hypothetical protein
MSYRHVLTAGDNSQGTITQRPVKENSKKTSGGFKDLLKEKCPWHLDDNHTTEQCYQHRRALKDTPEPRHPHDKKGKKKNDEGNDDFQEPDKTVNVLFGRLPSRRVQKATRREVMSIEPTVPTLSDGRMYPLPSPARINGPASPNQGGSHWF